MRIMKIAVAIAFGVVFLTGALSAHEVSWPGKRLAKLMPEAESFRQRQVSFSAEQLGSIEKALGQKVSGEDRSPIFYVAYGKDKKTLGVVVFVDVRGGLGVIELSLAMDDKGRISKIDVWENEDSDKIEERKFLGQFIGKSAYDAFRVGDDVRAIEGQEASSQAVASGLKRGLLLIYEAFLKKG